MQALRVVRCPVREGKLVRIAGLLLERLAPRTRRGGAVGPSYSRGSLLVMPPPCLRAFVLASPSDAQRSFMHVGTGPEA